MTDVVSVRWSCLCTETQAKEREEAISSLSRFDNVLPMIAGNRPVLTIVERVRVGVVAIDIHAFDQATLLDPEANFT